MKLSEFLATHVTDYSNPQSFASKLRQKRLAPLVDLVKSAHRERGKVEILDIGGTKNCSCQALARNFQGLKS